MLRDIFMFIFFSNEHVILKNYLRMIATSVREILGLNSIFEKYIHKIREHNRKFWVMLTSGAHK